MKLVRSGARLRWLLFRAPEFSAVRSEFVFWNVIIGGLVPVGLLVAGLVWGSGIAPLVLDPQAPLWTLGRSLNAHERAAGWLRISGTLTPSPGVWPPLCLVEQTIRSGKSTRVAWAGTVSNEAAVQSADGTIRRLDVRWVRWEPEALRSMDSGREAQWRERIPKLRSGSLREQCIEPGAAVFLDGCTGSALGESTIGACQHRPLVITAGDGSPKARREQIVSQAMGRLSALLAAAMCLALYGWHVLTGRSLVPAIARSADSGRPSKQRGRLGASLAIGMLWPVVLGLHLVAQWTRMRGYPEGSRAGYLGSLAVVCFGVIVLLQLAARQTDLRRALDLVIGVKTIELRAVAQGTFVGLVVEVAATASRVVGALTTTPHAWTALSVIRVYRDGKNHSAVVDYHGSAPPWLPIIDASGAGKLDLTNADFHVRAMRQIVKRPRAGDRAGPIAERFVSQPYSSCEIEESFIEPGERLYVLGVVQRLEAAPVDSRYRWGRDTAVVSGTAERPLFVYSGSERSLLHQLRRESIGLSLAFGVFVLAVGVLGVAMSLGALIW